MLKKIIKLLTNRKTESPILNTKSESPIEYSSFFLNYEYFNIAWGHQQIGYYIDSNENLFEYRNPRSWNNFASSNNKTSKIFWGGETDGIISAKDLYQNLKKCSARISESNEIKINPNEILESLLESRFEISPERWYDAGIKSWSILVLDAKNEKYNRILLKTDGDLILHNKSEYTLEILKYFESNFSEWGIEISE